MRDEIKDKANKKQKKSRSSKVVYTLEQLEEIKKTLKVVDMKVEEVDSTLNLVGYIGNNIKSFMPREEVSSIVGEDGQVEERHVTNKVGKVIPVCIKDIISKDDGIELVVSKKMVELKVRKWMYMHLKAGVKLKGIVVNLLDYGAFVDVGGGVIGLIKLQDISTSPIKHPSEILKVGQRINVIVKKYDRDTGKIELSYKEQLGTFEQNVKGLKEGDIVEGIVKNRIKTGIFIELKPNLVGMAEHVSGIEYGQKVLVSIKKISLEKKKIKLIVIG